MFQTSFWTCSFWVVQESEIIWIGKSLPLILCSHSVIKLSLTNRNSSSTIVWPDQFNIPCTHCLQCQPFMTNLELDGIELILMITSQVISKQLKWVMWYNKKKIYNTTTVGRGSHYIHQYLFCHKRRPVLGEMHLDHHHSIFVWPAPKVIKYVFHQE